MNIRKIATLALGALLAAIAATAQTTVTTPGGLAGRIPVFTGTSTLTSSILYQTSNGIGIGRYPNAMLDVGGNSTFRGLMGVSRLGDATTSAGATSSPIQMQASTWNSSLGKAVLPYFQLQTEPSGNNTAATGATFNFLYYSGIGSAPSETGLYINGNGSIHFAPTQTFPITQGPQGPAGPAGPTGPTGPVGPAGPAGPPGYPVWTSNTNLAPFTSATPQYGTVIGNSDALTGSDYYGSSKRSVIFPKACTLSNLSVNLGYESLSSPFVMETDVLVNGNVAASCSSGFATGYGFSCTSSATYSVPAGAQVVLQFSHTGTNPANVYPQVTFACN